MSMRALKILGVLLALAGPLPAGVALAEQAVPSEKNPPGDIPDSQVFVDYTGPGFTLKVPEGWGRTDQPDGAVFADKYNRISVTSSAAQAAPTAASAKSGEAKALEDSGHAVKVGDVKEVKLDGGKAVRIDYTANSEPNAVTNKQIRLEAVRYLLFANGQLVTLDMSAPKGADNVDQWSLMANSIRIK